MSYIVYNKTGKIVRVVSCPPSLAKHQVGGDEFMIKGEANDATQKIVDGKIVNKIPEEITRDNPPLPAIPLEKHQANITNEQWQDVLNRLNTIEKK